MIDEKPIGKCYVNDSLSKFWIDVPKNASKTISQNLWNQGWRDGDFTKEENIANSYEPSVVLRDPIARWLSGSLEISFHMYHYYDYDIAKFIERFEFFDFRNFEKRNNIHLLKYADLIGNLDRSKIHYFFLDDLNFDSKVKAYFNITTDLKYINKTETNERKNEILPYIAEIYNEPGFVDKLLEYYSDDYVLIDYAKSKMDG